MFYFYFWRTVSVVAPIALMVAAAIASCRQRRPALFVQLIGASMMAFVQLMTLFPLTQTNIKTLQVTPTWIWEFENWFSIVGLLFFALGYSWYWTLKTAENSN